MIELKETGKCVGCPHVDVETTVLYGDGVPVEMNVRCRHALLCDWLERRLREQMEAEQLQQAED